MTKRITATGPSNKVGEVLRKVPAARIRAFRSAVWKYWKENGRHDLPWRRTTDPYCVLVSEMMLQQTQVSRVLQKYKEFLKAFPTARVLAKAPLSDVLKAWSGLGYNRRAKYLHDTAKIILKNKGNFNEPVGQLKLPGVGPYTRAAVRVFAFNEPHTMIETNIRTVFIHHFFADKKTVSDKEILEIAKAAMPEGSPPAGGPRSWHWALMDYGAYLKQSGIRNNQKSAHYTKQSKFKGSLREVRGAILRQLHADRQPDTLHFPKKRLQSALAGLARDGLIVKEKGNWRIV